MTNCFYTDLKSFTDFKDFTNDINFKSLPDDWNIIITDIKGSTIAIREGRYKDVNLIGAASIIVATKVLKTRDFPFVFGGDGATILCSSEDLNEILKGLTKLCHLAKSNYKLNLRVGHIKMSELRKMNKEISVGKYQLTAGTTISFLKGEGISWAEKLIKENANKYANPFDSKDFPDLEGLTCRWKPNPSRNGTILTVIIQARNNSDEVYQKIIEKFYAIFPKGVESLNPAINKEAKYKSWLEIVKNEMRMFKHPLNFRFIFNIFIAAIAKIFFNGPFKPKQIQNYVWATPSHSDFRKFDNALRMVIDCTHDQALLLKTFLQSLYHNKEIYYGVHESEFSIMTCFVENLDQGGHIHFIDSSDGGYAMAAVQLKQQIKSSTLPDEF